MRSSALSLRESGASPGATVALRSARTRKHDAAEAAEELASALGARRPALALLLVSPHLDPAALAFAVRARLPRETCLLGAVALGGVGAQGVDDRVTTLALLHGDLEVGLASIDAREPAERGGQLALRRACGSLGVSPRDLGADHVALLLGAPGMGQDLLAGLAEENEGLVVIGGGVETEAPLGSAQLISGASVERGGAVLALIRTSAPWAVARSHAYEPTGLTVTVGKTDASGRCVRELDGAPAAARYAELTRLSPEVLLRSPRRAFATFPLAVRMGRDHFLRPPRMALPDGSLAFASALDEGTSLRLMRPGSPEQSVTGFFRSQRPEPLSDPRALLLFQARSRRLLPDAAVWERSVGTRLVRPSACVGVDTRFEIYFGMRTHASVAALVFGSSEGPEAPAFDRDI